MPFPAAAQMRTRRYALRDGDAGVARTIQFMRGLAKGSEGATHPHVRTAAITATRGLDARDKDGQISGVLDWVKTNIDFRGEYKELLQSPLVTLQLSAGDCDDHCTLISSMLKAIGFNTRFQTVAADAEDPNTFSHVYVEVETPPGSGAWLPLDSTVAGSYPGWRPENVFRTQAWPALGDDGGGFVASDGSSPSLLQQLTPLISPIDQAVAYKIAGTKPLVADLSFGNLFSPTPTGSSGVPWSWIVIGGFVFFVVQAWRRK